MHFNKISIIIPTKDRKEFLFETLRTCFNQNYPNLEVIVCDDGSTDGSLEMLRAEANTKSNLTILSAESNNGMRKNFERGLDLVEEGYVMFLGGDDGLMPNGLSEINKLINDHSPELITWPVHQFIYSNTKMKRGQIILTLKSYKKGPEHEWRSGLEFLKSQEKKLFYVSDPYCPMIYVKGIASIDLINKVKRLSPNNNFYQCSTPDGYSGLVLAGAVDKFLYARKAKSLHGISRTSQGLNYTMGGKDAKKLSNDFFQKSKNEKAHSRMGSVAYSPLVSMMTADFLYTANEINQLETNIDSQLLITKAIEELQSGNYSEERIGRELQIISDYSKHVGEQDFFQTEVKRKTRNNKYVFEGNGMSFEQLYLDSDLLKVFNVYEASHFINTFEKVITIFKFKVFSKAFFSSLRYKISSFKKGKKISDYLLDNH